MEDVVEDERIALYLSTWPEDGFVAQCSEEEREGELPIVVIKTFKSILDNTTRTPPLECWD